ncbi:UTRA domain-containing protein [Helcococcus kunzii]|uniref:UTRA domain-containing protein n=1 Tax=Helcococcus kunzii TaxID=40091 RepID=UPI0021A35252|nr:UTRA domain-containing protein [Helcococcus kunzii]MCT1796883.1 UTRA domain-containing protein [Helcococcus kunzii]MCT1989685.1 UTRA domain-containing protein [Helcococcus kunzii]
MVALYKQIYKDIKNDIDSKKLKVGEYIPSESQLQMKYKCSRDTVRKATAMLEQENYIEKSRGKQATVKLRNKYTFPASKIESFKELNKKDKLNAKTKLISLEYNYKENNDFSSKFDNCVKIVRVRSIENENIVLDIDYLDADKIQGLTRKVCENSIYEFIETNLGIKIGYSKKIVTVEKPTSVDYELLNLSENDLLVNVTSYTFTKDNELFQATISKHRYDKFRFETYATR